ncbi:MULTISPECIES: NCS2 family permease [Psychrobacter]|jgi:AGZA family xanthine/uracil permease-like MFS transporter|uniref:Xanthine/uracil/thiamine/ascorbate permease family protein n=2 Tax=Psychrobacter TaxID=497 RepID=A0A6N7C0M7_9GAMM|nr:MULTISPECIES: NCS2 family permease [Psychrobacter]KAF0568862.1 Xanthine/uracil/thiamine/ascorbate permease family protein [Psychrobacter nivimaris]MBA6244082.1 NCS2 family permease [Psychrobacter sp. Urea-trap-18]MBA6284876.1 NCS2 family permease [Psychrobacter sp. Urea-trap-16]MBA6319478.1 NCS2 family permease [Psychrobacter sp. Urea-trap-20]MBA6335356.1 NCS2 family permease [Psychrobacter sp. Urea-trap-19]|tara:strand:+ start:5029 stop:6324 length:1296 start_codon:yes stop_codon:yes gene_type:complete
MNAIERYFGINGENTTIKTEIIAGITTFLTMAYIIFVNPNVLADAGMDKGAVFVATCIAAAVGCFIMGIYARLPVALAPGMGLNAFFTYGVVLGMGYAWQTALGAVFLSGCIFVLLSLFKIREAIINAIPTSLKNGVVAGIGAFLAFIALQSAGIIVNHDATLVGLGDMTSFGPVMASLGFVVIIGLSYKRVPGAVTIGILLVALISLLMGYTQFTGIISSPPSIAPTLMQLDIAGAFDVGMISVIFAFLFVDLFDTAGTLIATTSQAKLTDKDGNIPNMGKALLADSTATVAGSLLGTSSTTSYIESISGIASGGRTGLMAVTVGVLFLFSIFFSPLAGMIPAYATAGAIFYVAVLMMGTLKDINWSDLTEAAPVVVVLLFTPLTYSIADGIALGFITFTAVKAIAGKFADISIAVWILTAILLFKIIFL